MEIKNKDQLLTCYDLFISDREVDELELGLENSNIFEILAISNKEIRHSNFLAWLLNPNGSHGLNDLFLIRFLRHLYSSDKAVNVNQVSLLGIDTSTVKVKREWKHIDLLVELDEVVISIENKIFAKESEHQLKKYRTQIEKSYPGHKKIYVYLTPDGLDSIHERENYQCVSYQFVVETLENILSVYGSNINPSPKTYIKDYITTLKRKIMGGDDLSNLAQKIYYGHKELLDFILENRPDATDEVSKLLKEICKECGFILGSENKYYVRFYTQPIEKFIYKGSEHRGWKKKESFLFEFNLKSNNHIGFKTVIAPTDSDYDRNVLSQILSGLPGSKEPAGDRWLVHFSRRMNFNMDAFHEMSEEEVQKKINKFIKEKVTPIITLVEEAFIENEEVLLKIKNDAVSNASLT